MSTLLPDEGPMERLLRGMTDYQASYGAFRWKVPARFNFARDVVDAWARHGDRLALVWADAKGRGESFRFSDMARLSNRLASALRRQGLKKGDRVILMTRRRPEWQIAFLACLKLGAVAIPCIDMLTPRDVAYRVQHAGVTAVIALAETASKFAELESQFAIKVAIGDKPAGWLGFADLLAQGEDDFAADDTAAEDPVVLYFTSGSTGYPKGVTHASRALWAWRVSAFAWLDLGREDRIWCTADVGWSKAGTSILFGPWSAGSSVFFYDGPFEPEERLRLLAQHGVTVYCAAGTELTRVVDAGVERHDLSALGRIVSAGEALNPAFAERWLRATGILPAEAYGQTETLMTVLNVPSLPVVPGSMGFASPGSEVAIVDDAGQRLPQGSEGNIAVGADNPQIMLGYWQEPERTAAAYVEAEGKRWFITGDIGRQDQDGRFFYAGRRDDVINSAGYRIGPQEVESVLAEHPAVQECAVVGAPDEERGEIVKAFVVLRSGHEPSPALAEAMIEHCRQATAPYKRPRALEFLADLPKTPTGKIRRNELRAGERAKTSPRTSQGNAA